MSNEMRKLMEAIDKPDRNAMAGSPTKFTISWMEFTRVNTPPKDETIATFTIVGAFTEMVEIGFMTHKATYHEPEEWDSRAEDITFDITSEKPIDLDNYPDEGYADIYGTVIVVPSQGRDFTIDLEEICYHNVKTGKRDLSEPLDNPMDVMKALPDYIYSYVLEKIEDDPENFYPDEY